MEFRYVVHFGLVAVSLSLIYHALKSNGYLEEEDEFKFINSPIVSSSDVTDEAERLIEHTRNQFLEPDVVKVTEKVYVAIGFALANSIMIIGDDGVIIVDTTETVESMLEILTEFRKITNKPVKAIILTHFHIDHIHGIDAILQEPETRKSGQKVEIFAHELTKGILNQHSHLLNIIVRRGVRQFGVILPIDKNSHTGTGLGLIMRMTHESRHFNPQPTVTFQDRAEYTIAGVNFELIHTPGETDDQISVWLPQDDVLIPGDNIYKSFPNLFAIRGSPPRDSKKWYESLDKIRKLNAEYLVPCHTRPIIGRDDVDETLLVYRDGIKYVHDQTLRLLNLGLHPTRIAEKVKLPDKLARHPYLQQYYGTVKWCVRGIFDYYMGWFGGDPLELEPMDPKERAIKLTQLATLPSTRTKNISGLEIILKQAQKSLTKSHDNYVTYGEHILDEDKWALELANAVLEISESNSKLTQIAKTIQVSALTSLGIESQSSTGRNYFLTVAKEIELNLIPAQSRNSKIIHLKSETLISILELLCLKVNGLKCQEKTYTIILDLTDKFTKFALTLRNSVCDVVKETDFGALSNPVTSFTMTSQTWRSLMAEEIGFDAGKIETDSKTSVKILQEFMSCFDPMV